MTTSLSEGGAAAATVARNAEPTPGSAGAALAATHEKGSLWATLLAGGIGSRFWPASTPDRPKQLLPLVGPDPIVVDALRRAESLVPPDRLKVLAPDNLVKPIASVAKLGADAFLVEPEPRGTAPALVRAAWEIARTDPEAVMVSLHADHLVRPGSAFRETVLAAAEVARRERILMTVAAAPDRPETGYGYVRPAGRLNAPRDHCAYRVDAFVEKPVPVEAVRLLESGARWNTGIFIWPVRVFLEEAAAHAPEVSRALPMLEQGDATAFFAACAPVSVDDAVLARSTRVGAVDATFEWDDMGSWESLSRTRAADRCGNVRQGDVVASEASGNIAVAEQGRIVLLGVEDLLVVRTEDTTLVMPRRESPNLKRHLDELRASAGKHG